MNHSEFLKKWVGKTYIEPWIWTAECVWATKLYCKEIGHPIKAFWGSAWNGWKTGCPFDNTWERVIKTPFNYPKEWDIIFWSENRCKYGHVAVGNKLSNPMLLRYVDGNGTGNWDPITVRFWTYKNCTGWYTPKR
jgi:hypothetical protein